MSAPHYVPQLQHLKAYQGGITEAELKRRYGLNHISKLASNENPLGPSPQAISAAQNSLLTTHRYPDDAAPELKAKVAKNWQVEANQVTLGAGSSEVIEMLLRAYVEPGAEIITPTHSFVLYRLVATAIGAKTVTVDEDQWQIDLDKLLQKITTKTRAIIIANPNNPTGTWLAFDKLKDFIAHVPQNILIIIDEAYVHYMQQSGYQSVASLISRHNNLAVLHTFSKIYGLAGLRIGYGLTSSEIADVLGRLRKPFNVNQPAICAAIAALDDHAFLEKSRQANSTEQTRLLHALASFGLDCIAQSGNFLTTQVGPQAISLCEKLLQRGVIIRDLAPYKMPEYLRISVGLPEENSHFLSELKSLLR